MMIKMKFKCTLQSDIILSQDSSSEGNQYCLDFIPGNNFLGIVAGQLYNTLNKDEALKVFHSGKVRFGDAHPSIEGKPRGLKVPGAMFYPKLKKPSEECYIHHLIPNPDDDSIKGLQLKQCREGFYAFEENSGKPVCFNKNYAIKSAYDSEKRRSKDGKMFGYQSLPEGLVLYFEIESELDDTTNRKIVEAIVGKKHIGHSRTAQYGLVDIIEHDFKEADSTDKTFVNEGKQYATVYADGRLIFFDENGEPTFQPTAEQLGFEATDTIDWSKSQVRTFQYSPWNGKRHTYDTDRCGVEKGSVFVVKCKSTPSKTYIGAYNNEGFGKVIYNPAFLAGDNMDKALCTLEEKPKEEKRKAGQIDANTPLLMFLKQQKDAAESTQKLYDAVNDFVNENGNKFKGDQFASQWSSIRNIAMITPDEAEIPEKVLKFLEHGVAKDKWEEGKRKDTLKKFMENNKANIRDIIINLASEMAKKCRKGEKKQ